VTAKEITQDLWNLRCGIDIMEWLLSGLDGRPQIPIYTKTGIVVKTKADYRRQSYWEKLNRPNGGEIGRLIRSFQPCYDEKLIPGHRSPHGPYREEYIFPKKYADPNYQADSDQDQLELEYLYKSRPESG
jgi:hypothetical protein